MLFRLVFFSLVFLFQNVFANEVDDLFEAEVLIESQSLENRNTAIRVALTKVLGRILVADRNGMELDSTVQAVLSDAPGYVNEYSFSAVSDGDQTGSASHVMRVTFDKNALLEQLHNSRLHVWAESRPEILIWLVVEERGKKQLFNAELMPDLGKMLEKAAREKGLTLLFPLMDMEDQQKVTIEMVLNAGSGQLMSASGRYDVEAILAGKILKKHQCWQIDWVLNFNEEVSRLSLECNQPDEILELVIQDAYNQLSSHFVVKSDAIETDRVTIKISGIGSMTDMIRVVQFLESQTMIKSVRWFKVKEGYNLYLVMFEGERKTLQDALGYSKVLVAEGIVSQESDVISYRLLPENKNN